MLVLVLVLVLVLELVLVLLLVLLAVAVVVKMEAEGAWLAIVASVRRILVKSMVSGPSFTKSTRALSSLTIRSLVIVTLSPVIATSPFSALSHTFAMSRAAVTGDITNDDLPLRDDAASVPLLLPAAAGAGMGAAVRVGAPAAPAGVGVGAAVGVSLGVRGDVCKSRAVGVGVPAEDVGVGATLSVGEVEAADVGGVGVVLALTSLRFNGDALGFLASKASSSSLRSWRRSLSFS